jgi:hypothetical protein
VVFEVVSEYDTATRLDKKVAAFQRGRDAADLHRGGDFKLVGVKPRHQGGRKRELRKLCRQN